MRRPQRRSEATVKALGVCAEAVSIDRSLSDGGTQTNARVRLVGPPIGVSEPIQSKPVRGSTNMM